MRANLRICIYLPFISSDYRGGGGNVTMLKRWAMVTCAVISAVMPATAWPAFEEDSAPACRPVGSMMRLTDLPEASGLVASRVTTGRLWAHNDSGKPEIFALDAKGTMTGRVSISGAALEDWEALASGACGKGTCLYIGDIGDNGAKRSEIIIYRVPEPAKADGSAQVDGVFRAAYPDGSHDAEALLAGPDGTLYIVTKGETGHVALYRFPRELRTGTTLRLERVGAPLSKGESAQDARITDGAISSDGEWVVLRTRGALTFYRAAEFLKGDFKVARRVDLKSVGEPQGEAVAFGPSSTTVYVAGEGGGKSQPGTLAVLSCAK
jgi:hypothetical protein